MAERSPTSGSSPGEGTLAATVARWRRSADHGDERSAWLNQMLLGAVVLVAALEAVVVGFSGDVSLFFAGVVAIFILTAATLVIPWTRIPTRWKALIPLLDIAAILAIRQSEPTSGFSLILVFPAMWLSSGFGFGGLLLGMAVPTIGYWIAYAAAPSATFTTSTVLLPLLIIAVCTTSYLTARRNEAHRMLHDKQADLLAATLERSRRQEQSALEVLDAVDFGVMRLGADGRIAVTNDTHARLLNATLTDDAESQIFRADGVTPLTKDQSPLTRARRGESFDQQVIWFGQEGDRRQALSVTVRRMRDVHGADVGAIVVSRDVTTELTALRARDELVASVSHELRTPLTSILGYLDLAIDDESVPEPARKRLEIAERNTERLLGIVADILRASTASQSSVDVTIRPVDADVGQLVLAAVESMQPHAAGRSVSLDTSRIEPARAWADPLRLRQVVDNILSNAIKYSREGGSVTVGCTTDADSTWILVRDTGPGMAEDEMTGLFERFYRTSSMRRRGIQGTGLGLSISRDIVRAHGGEITVHSSPGVGSTFIVRLPAVRGAAAPAPRMNAASAGAPASADQQVKGGAP
jgi:signal transduction histidine kinase